MSDAAHNDDAAPTHRPTLQRMISTCGDLCSNGQCPNINHALNLSEKIDAALNHAEPLVRAAASTLLVMVENTYYVESPAGCFTLVNTEIGRIAYLLDIFLAMGVRETGLRFALQKSKNVGQILKMFESFDETGLKFLCARIVDTEDCSETLCDFMRQAQSIVTVLKGEYCKAP